MTRTLSLVAKNGPGYGLPDGRCFPFSGVSGKAVTATFCLSYGERMILPRVKVGTLPWAPRGVASFVCKATASGNRKNPGASKQNKSGLSRGKNRENEEGDDPEMNEELELDFSKSGSFHPISSNNPSPQPTATPGKKEKEIAELFRKVQVQLRERAASKKGEKKVETAVKEESNKSIDTNNKSSDTIGPLLQLLRKHSAEKGKGSVGDILAKDKPAENGAISHGMETYPIGSTKDVYKVPQGSTSSRKHSAEKGKGSVRDILAKDKPAENGVISHGMETYPFGSTKDVYKAPQGSTSSRSPSKFTRKSPIPREKPNSDDDSFDQIVSRWTSSGTRKKRQGGISAEPEEEPEMESESESESESDSGYSPVKSRWTPKETKKTSWTPKETKKTILTDILPEFEDDPEFDSILDSESDSDTDLDLEPKPAAPELKTEAVYSFSDEDAYDETETVNAAVEEVDLTGLKVVELRELAKSRGLSKTSRMKKGELIELLSSSV